MISTTASLDIDNDHIINFKIVYSSDHIGWIQFIEKKIQVQPKLVHISDDRVFFFVDSDEFTEASRNWHRYLKKNPNKDIFHIRIIRYSQSLTKLIKHWYANIKNLHVSITYCDNIYHILLNAPKNLRQFIIGKSGAEIKLLASFLDKCIIGDYNYQLKIM